MRKIFDGIQIALAVVFALGFGYLIADFVLIDYRLKSAAIDYLNKR